MSRTLRPASERDTAQVRALLAEAFSLELPDELSPRPVALDGRWVLVDDGAVRATALVVDGTQWFGGAPVRSGLVRAVAVDSPARGNGLGRDLVAGILTEQHERGVALSALYPSVPGPYRRAGYELAGEHQRLTAPLAGFGRTRAATPERLGTEGATDIRACYEEWARGTAGSLGRSETWWQEIVLPGDRTYLYGVREHGRLVGYLAYTKQAAPGQDLPYSFDIVVQDAAWTTTAAGLALLDLLGSHAGLGVSLHWPGHAGDLWGRALGGHVPRVAFSYPWMLRVVSVPHALAERGYPPLVSASVALSVTDDLLLGNARSYRLEVEAGRAEVTPVAAAAATIDAGALAPLYTGFLSARSLAAEGRLHGASAAEIATLDEMFAGPRPLMSEMF